MRLGLVMATVVLVGCSAGELRHDERLDFEDVPVGTSRTLAVVLRNGGDSSLNVLLGVDDERFSLAAQRVQVPARSSTPLEVTFTPTGLGVVEGSLSLQGPSGLSTVVLRGRGTGASVDVAEEVLLGRIRLVRGEPTLTVPVPLRVGNAGTLRSSLTVTVRSSDAELCVGDDCASWTGVVPAGSSLDVPLVVKPVRDGERAWSLTVESSDPLRPTRTVVVRAVVEYFEPCVLSVPSSLEVPMGSPGVLFITHTGPGTCLVRDLSITSTPDVLRFVDAPPLLPMVLPSGERHAVRVGWLRPRPAMATGVIRLVPGGAAPIEIPVTLAPLNLGACLVLAPSAIDLGTVSQGCNSATRTVHVYNSCSSPVTIDSLRITAPAGEGPGGPNCPGAVPCPEFHLASGISAGTELAPAGVARFQVRYRPINFGPDTGAVVLSAAGAELVFAMQGRGDSPNLQVETHRQSERAKSNVLFMVDTSPSFGPLRANTRQNIETLLQSLSPDCVDVQVAFAPADGAADAGVSFSLNDAGVAWSSSLESGFVERALGAFDALPAGSETEACVGPAATLMQSANIRADSTLAGVCVSDALEQTPSPQLALQQFQAGRLSSGWNAIIGRASSTCAVESVDDGVHQQLVESTWGGLEDICSPNWSQSFIRNTFGGCLRSQFFLASAPSSPVDVRVDGQLVTGTWQYLAASNSIVFDPNALPPPGSTITITYSQTCAP